MLVDTDISRSVIEWGRPDRQMPKWRGVDCQQFPADLWRYAELCWELRPPFVVEVGTAEGGTALFLADVLKAIGSGAVVAVDIRPVELDDPSIVVATEDSIAFAQHFQPRVAGKRGLILLDGNHQAAHVARELDLYAPLADYLVVEDTIMEHLQGMDDGPHWALKAWLPDHPEFTVDPDPIPGPTQHPGGWLRRISG